MNDNLKENEETWSVEPPKRDHRRLKTALRIALIVAALGAVAVAGMVLFGESIKKQPLMGIVVVAPHGEPSHPEIAQTIKQANIECAESYGQKISGDGDAE